MWAHIHDEWPDFGNVIHHLDALEQRASWEQKRLFIFRFARVSSEEQRRNSNLKNQARWLRKRTKERGIKCIGNSSETASGKTVARPDFIDTINRAKLASARHPEALVAFLATSTDRLVRHPNFNGTESTSTPLDDQIEALMELGGGMILFATYLHPDAPMADVKRHQLEVAECAGKITHRPRTKPSRSTTKFRVEHLPEVLRLHNQNPGISNRELGRECDVPESTIRRWLAQYGKE
jgi:hypothetical protein